MTAGQVKHARKRAGFTQRRAAEKLHLTQAYLSMVERGRRVLRPPLARKLAKLYGVPFVPPVARRSRSTWSEDEAARQLGNLGYPGFAYLRSGRKKNPAELLAWALAQPTLDAKLAEALPWVVLHFDQEFDWDWLARQAKWNDRQNRLGYVVSVGRQVAQRGGKQDLTVRLRQREADLERSRLFEEDTYFEQVRSEAMREWLRQNQTPEARHWRVLTDFGPHQVRYVH